MDIRGGGGEENEPLRFHIAIRYKASALSLVLLPHGLLYRKNYSICASWVNVITRFAVIYAILTFPFKNQFETGIIWRRVWYILLQIQLQLLQVWLNEIEILDELVAWKNIILL